MTTQRHSPFALQRSALGALTSSLIHFSKDLERLTDQITATNDNEYSFGNHTDAQDNCFTTHQHLDGPAHNSLIHNHSLPSRDQQMECTELVRVMRNIQANNFQTMERLNQALLRGSNHNSSEKHNEVKENTEAAESSCSIFKSRNQATPRKDRLPRGNMPTSAAKVTYSNDDMEENTRVSLDAIESWRAQQSSQQEGNIDSIRKGKAAGSVAVVERQNDSNHLLCNRTKFGDAQAYNNSAQLQKEKHVVDVAEQRYGQSFETERTDRSHHDGKNAHVRSRVTHSDADTSKIDSSALNAALRRLSIAPSESSMLRDATLEYSEDYSDDYGDDATFATQKTIIRPGRIEIASLRGSLEAGDRSVSSSTDEPTMTSNTMTRSMLGLALNKMVPSSPAVHTVREVFVHLESTPPGQNNLTMDQSFFHETDTVASPSHSRIMEQADLSSVTSLLVTPILDRYRVEVDDSSVGIKVVPNERGFHRRAVEERLYRKPFAEASNTSGKRQTTTSFRKTPHPKKIRKPQLLPIVENESPRLSKVSIASADTVSKRGGNPPSVGRISISSPTMVSPSIRADNSKSESNTTRRRLTEDYDLNKISPSTASFTPRSNPVVSVSASKTPLTAAWVAKHMSSDANLMEFMGMEEVSFTDYQRSSRSDEVSTSVSIKLISVEEYNFAPKVVQMQVGLSEVNTAAEILSHWTVPQERVTESNAYSLLPFPESKSKSILLSLCHWRRMMMHVENDGERSFSLCC